MHPAFDTSQRDDANGQRALAAPVSPLDFDMARAAGVSSGFSDIAKTVLPDLARMPACVTLAGGPGYRSLAYDVSTLDRDDHITPFVPQAWSEDAAYSYSVIAGHTADTQFRRPFGFATVAGDLAIADTALKADIATNCPAITYHLRLWVGRIQKDTRLSDSYVEDGVVGGILEALISLIKQLSRRAQDQDNIWNLDICLAKTDGHGVSDRAMLKLTTAIVELRRYFESSEADAVSVRIGDIEAEWMASQIM
jgi:hypothetical protein